MLMLTGGGERSVLIPRTWPDEYLDYWGDVYQDHPQIRERGVLFEFFLAHPVPVLIALRIPCPAQESTPSRQLARLVAALERSGARRTNGALIEKLRHARIVRTRHRRRDLDGRLL